MKKISVLMLVLFFPFFMTALWAGNPSGEPAADWLPPGDEEYFAINLGGSISAQLNHEILDGQDEYSAFYDSELIGLDYRTRLFQLLIEGSMRADEKYSEQEPYFGGRYIFLNDAYVRADLDRFSFKAGQGPQKDIVDSPYSLFISSKDNPVLHGEFTYAGDFFFYKTRWVSMNSNSALTYYGVDGAAAPSGSWPDGSGSTLDSTLWLDKGMNFKVYGFQKGDWKFGLEDVVVYLGRSFDPGYFLNPLPQYFLQLITSDTKVPWEQAGNSKSMLGFFAVLDRDSWGGDAQILIDDINLDFLPFVPERSFKTKMAWNIGGWKDTAIGRFGFHHAGATKYTFQSTRTIESGSSWGTPGYVSVPYSILPYEYTYFPVNQYESDSGTMPIESEDLYAGYKYGENNLAFLIDYENELFKNSPFEFKLYSSFEYVLNGSKSPSNPWHEYDSPRNPDIESSSILLFTGAPIEHILRVKTTARKKLGDFTLMADLLFGYVFNGSKLVDVTPNYEDYSGADVTWDEPKIYVPQNGNNYPLFQMTLGLNYSLRLN